MPNFDATGRFFFPPETLPMAQLPAVVMSGPSFGGINNQFDPQFIDESQAADLKNVTWNKLGNTTKRQGYHNTTADPGSSYPARMLCNFRADDGTGQLVVEVDGDSLRYLTSAYNNAAVTPGSWTTAAGTTFFVNDESDDIHCKQINNLLFIFNRNDNVRVMNASGSVTALASGLTLPAYGIAAEVMNQRLFVADKNLITYSDPVVPYSFSRNTDAIKFDVGRDSQIIAIKRRRENEMIVFLTNAIEMIVEDVSDTTLEFFNITSWRRTILEPEIGCSARDSVVSLGDDMFFLDDEGMYRKLSRTVDSKQKGVANRPISDLIRDFIPGDVNKNKMYLAQAIIFDNKVYLALPSAASSYNDTVYVYDLYFESWSSRFTGLNVGKWLVSDLSTSGKNELYFTPSDGTGALLYHMFDGKYQDLRPNNASEGAGSAIAMQIKTKAYDFGFPASDKIWHWLEVEASGALNASLDIYISVDEASATLVGSVNLEGADAPALDDTGTPPVLPVQLVDQPRVRKRFHLESKTRGKRAQLIIQNEDASVKANIIGYRFGAIVENVELER